MPRSRPRSFNIRVDLWEIAVVIAALIAGGMLVYRQVVPRNPVLSEREYAFFEKTYGPDHYSEREEEWMIRDYFQERHGGFFVDVGAHHYQSNSKTYYLEKHLGWSGIAIEPQTQFAEEYKQYRPQTRFFPFFVSDVSNSTAKLYITHRATMVASSNKDFVSMFTPTGKPDEERDVPTITLTDLLDSEGVQKIDFMSMDIELHEPQALRGFDIQRFRPSLVCIEGLPPVRQQILDYFARNGYVIVGRYIWVDRENFYFKPLDEEPPPPAEQ